MHGNHLYVRFQKFALFASVYALSVVSMMNIDYIENCGKLEMNDSVCMSFIRS